jgi:hypothetical protein
MATTTGSQQQQQIKPCYIPDGDTRNTNGTGKPGTFAPSFLHNNREPAIIGEIRTKPTAKPPGNLVNNTKSINKSDKLRINTLFFFVSFIKYLLNT